MAQPTLPQFSQFNLQFIMENWSNYFSPGINKIVAKFKFYIQVLQNGLDANTVYLFEANVLDSQDILDMVALNIFDTGVTFLDGDMIVTPTDVTLAASVTTGGETLDIPANTGQKIFNGEFKGVGVAPTLVNCQMVYADCVLVAFKA